MKWKELCQAIFYEASIILIPKLDKEIITTQQNYRLVSVMNINIKCVNKVPANYIPQHIKKFIHHGIKCDSSKGCEDVSTYSVQLMWCKTSAKWRARSTQWSQHMQKKHLIYFHKLGVEAMYLKILKSIYEKSPTDVILSSKNLKVFPLRSRKRQEYSV